MSCHWDTANSKWKGQVRNSLSNVSECKSFDTKEECIQWIIDTRKKHNIVIIEELTIEQIIEQCARLDNGKLFWTINRGRFVEGDELGSHDHYGYLTIKINRKHYKVHRLVWLKAHGNWPRGEIDHINGVKDDNRLVNMREVNRVEQNVNRAKPMNNTSGVIGVGWDNTRNKWYARIGVNNKHINLGRFSEFDEAVRVRKKAEISYCYHENHGRTQ